MTYKELYESAIDKLEKSKITLGEFEKMIEPLNAEIATADSDTISRQAAIEAIGEKPVAWSKGEYERGLQNQWGYDVSAIKKLPSAQPKPHWHPVSEHPQEDDDYLLLTHEKTKYGTFKRIIIGAWNGATKEWLEEYEGMYRDVNHPVAWISKEELLLLKGCEVTK